MSELENIWSGLARPYSGLVARNHPRNPLVWLALDPQGRRHVLVGAEGIDTGIAIFRSHGLLANTDLLAIEGHPPRTWIDIACLDPALHDAFEKVAVDIASGVEAGTSTPLDSVRVTLRNWQWFWGKDRSALSGDAALGLFGELWFLDRWAPAIECVERWAGPMGHRHDFVSPRVSVEVKTTRARSDGAARHRITALDQLETPERAELFLFSLQVSLDPSAGNSLSALVERVRLKLRANRELLEVFNERLSRVGWSPANVDEQKETYRVIAEELYRVDSEFPSLTRRSFSRGVPAGVDGITYFLNLAVCQPWIVAKTPLDAFTLLQALKP